LVIFFLTACEEGTPFSSSISFSCSELDDPSIEVIFSFNKNARLAQLNISGQTYEAVQIRSGSGERYVGSRIEFWEHQGEVLLTVNGTQHECKKIIR
jgi:membrane-bound inhibitor of C-type lysozyme